MCPVNFQRAKYPSGNPFFSREFSPDPRDPNPVSCILRGSEIPYYCTPGSHTTHDLGKVWKNLLSAVTVI